MTSLTLIFFIDSQMHVIQGYYMMMMMMMMMTENDTKAEVWMMMIA